MTVGDPRRSRGHRLVPCLLHHLALLTPPCCRLAGREQIRDPHNCLLELHKRIRPLRGDVDVLLVDPGKDLVDPVRREGSQHKSRRFALRHHILALEICYLHLELAKEIHYLRIPREALDTLKSYQFL